MARALYDARRAGLKVTGFAADRRDYGRVHARGCRSREAAARVEDARPTSITGADPHFLGAQHPDHRRRTDDRGDIDSRVNIVATVP